MSKLYDSLMNQQKDHPNTEIFEIYEFLKNTTGGVWSSQWQIFTKVTFEGFPSYKRWYEPSPLWYNLKAYFQSAALN